MKEVGLLKTLSCGKCKDTLTSTPTRPGNVEDFNPQQFITEQVNNAVKDMSSKLTTACKAEIGFRSKRTESKTITRHQNKHQEIGFRSKRTESKTITRHQNKHQEKQ
ncbi:hypothetical protein QE152_g1996 [Popillia japonica]|uniref:Uncharacterized protein n=1 Tax=Popillia japonica TaxID=7064 RepID=A0AAW1N4E4_POPJA